MSFSTTRTKGVGQFLGINLGDGMISSLKGKTFFLPKAWADAGFKQPAASFDPEAFKRTANDDQVTHLVEGLKIPKEMAKALLSGTPSAVQADAS